MGRDDSPPIRQRKQLERKQGQRASYDRILIVSEGSKTEPNYFREIRNCYRLHTANVQIVPGGKGTAPDQVVAYAEELFRNGSRDKGISKRAFESVYVVFDRDDHKEYFDALNKARALDGKLKNDEKQPVRFVAIASVPCFELWLLLHYEDVLAPIDRKDIEIRLQRYMPGYAKSKKDLFSVTCAALDAARKRAVHLRTSLGHTAFSNDPRQPFTDVDRLVDTLQGLKG